MDVAKHNSAKKAKEERNAVYALKYRQRKCKKCGHKSSKVGTCRLCGGEMQAKSSRFVSR